MRKSVGILVLVVGALLLCAVGAGRVCTRVARDRMAQQMDTLSVRLDSCAEAVSLLCGMDSLYRVKMHADPWDGGQGDSPDSSILGPTDSLAFAVTDTTSLEVPDSTSCLGMADGSMTAVDRMVERADSLAGKVRALSGCFRQTQVLSVEARERARFIPSICPLKEGTFRFTAGFGVRVDPLEGDGRMHEGIDLACPQGNPVHVTADGVVSFIDSDIFGYGNCIIVDHGFGYKTRYAHLSIIRTSENIRLKRGDVIGETGVSGRATGPHLHYEVIRDGVTVDPEEYIDIKL